MKGSGLSLLRPGLLQEGLRSGIGLNGLQGISRFFIAGAGFRISGFRRRRLQLAVSQAADPARVRHDVPRRQSLIAFQIKPDHLIHVAHHRTDGQDVKFAQGIRSVPQLKAGVAALICQSLENHAPGEEEHTV